MSEHIDIVKNEWLSGLQLRVAVVTLEGEDVKVSALVDSDPSWGEFVLRPILNATSSEFIHSSKDAAHFFEMLPTAINNSYVFATPSHSMETCPFRDANSLALTRGGLEAAAS